MRAVLYLLCAAGAVAGFLILPFRLLDAPLDYQLYFNQKIFYYHVPAAFMMFLSVFVAGIASIGYLSTRRPGFDDTAAAAADLVVVFGGVVMVSGPIWAKAAWGVWWVWDARLTSSLLLWMIFIAYALLRRYGGPGSERLGAGLALFGMVNVPLVYFAVNFWKTQHPSNTVVPGLPPGMRGPFLIGVLTFLCLFFVLLFARLGVGRRDRQLAAVTDLAVETGDLE
jgi:heme exporter protein C